MKCPHCLVSFHHEWERQFIAEDLDSSWWVYSCTCPDCKRLIVALVDKYQNMQFARPKAIARNPLPNEVDDQKVILDYQEACLVLVDSPKASAALRRHGLQYILRTKALVKSSDLSTEIQTVLDSNTLPSELSENLDAIRAVGNFAAHPIKSKSSGEIVDVETGEAEWNLDVLEELVDFYFVRPAKAKLKREALNQKLQDAGKPPLKS
jgi:hypothetical protein